MKKGLIAILMTLAFCSFRAEAQDIALKTNLLYGATTTLNLGAEVGLGNKTSLEIMGGYNPWDLNADGTKKIKHWMVMPEFRYWFCENFNGHFLGLHSGYAFYNISGVPILFQPKETQNHRYQGWATGAGLAYGYSLILGNRWNLEFSLGGGWIYTRYDKYDCGNCGSFKGQNEHHYFGLTKAAVSLIFIIN